VPSKGVPNGQDPAGGRLEPRLGSDDESGGAREQSGDTVTTTPTNETAEAEARRTFHEQLDELRVDVIRLAALTNEQVAGGTQALLDGDLAAAERVIEADEGIDDLTHSIEDRTYLALALQQPIAKDLRFLVTVMRVAHELERSADLMVNVAKTTRRLYPHQLDPKMRGIIDRMGTQASVQTRVAIDAFADADPSQAAALADMDDAMDELTKSLFRHILAGDGSDEAAVLLAVQMALVGRHYERTADHAVTIAERVRFMVTGAHQDAVDGAEQ
jgi:phosphate transport system protein